MSQNSSSIFPEKIIKTNSDINGGFTSSVYTLEAWGNHVLFNLLFIGAFIIMLAPLVSVLFLFFYCCYITNKPIPNSHNLFGALAAIYFLVDFYHYWWLSQLITIFFSDENLHKLLYLNMGLVMTHIVFLLFGESIVDFFKLKVFAIACVLGILYVAYYSSKEIVDYHVINFVIHKK